MAFLVKSMHIIQTDHQPIQVDHHPAIEQEFAMSDARLASAESEVQLHPNQYILRVLKPGLTNLGGVQVRRALPSRFQRKIGPWIFFDHAGPAHFAEGEGVDVRPHPHINLATVTYLFEGQFLHRDSIGSVQIIKPGDINLMVAGKGIVHSERTPPDLRRSGHTLHGLQLWLALPEAHEEILPAFYHYEQSTLPTAVIDGVSLRVMMGSAFGLTSPVKTFAQTLYIEANLSSGQRLLLPEADERAIYLASGSASIDNATLDTFSMAILDSRPGISVKAEADCRVVVIGGGALSERFIEWNFVSSNKARIARAKQDWQAGRFAKVPGDDQEFIPLP